MGRVRLAIDRKWIDGDGGSRDLTIGAWNLGGAVEGNGREKGNEQKEKEKKRKKGMAETDH